MSMGGSSAFRNAIQQAQGAFDGGVTTPEQPMVYQQPVNFYQSAMPTAMGFYNQGALVDPSLLAQQAILGRQPTSAYQPLVTPESYQNFYQVPAANNLVIPDYRPMAKQFAAGNSSAATQPSADGSYDAPSGNGLGYDPFGTQTLAPVTVIDPFSGLQIGYDAGGTVASGMPGSVLGVGTVGDDATGPDAGGGWGDGGTGVGVDGGSVGAGGGNAAGGFSFGGW